MTPDALAALHARAFSANRAWSASEFASLLSHAGTFAQTNQHCFALIRVVVDEAEVLTLATDPTYRRHGHARAVLHDAMTQARSQGATAMFLEVAEDNPAAIGLYVAAGFAQVGRRPGYYVPKNSPPIAALIMRRDLKGA